MKSTKNVYEIITERITDKLKKGCVPWHRPWKGGIQGIPQNAVSGHRYSGLNVWLLSCQGYDSNQWLTYNQMRKFPGAWIIATEKPTPVIFWKWFEKEDAEEQGEKVKIPCLRYYYVWNVSQIGGLPDKFDHVEEQILSNVFTPMEEAEKIVTGYQNKPTIKHQGERAFYVSLDDSITMPKKERFESSEEYFSTLFHECIHSTGNEKRLNRKGISETHYFGDSVYSQEELCAEMGSAYLCGIAGIENKTIDNSAAYINGWLQRLQNNPKWLVQAAAQAQKAADYIQNKSYEGDKEEK